jgi:hypothetical protein
MTPDFEGITGTKSETKYHTVAFQDRKDAVNFCSLLLSQPDKFVADSAEVVPLSPKVRMPSSLCSHSIAPR